MYLHVQSGSFWLQHMYHTLFARGFICCSTLVSYTYKVELRKKNCFSLLSNAFSFSNNITHCSLWQHIYYNNITQTNLEMYSTKSGNRKANFPNSVYRVITSQIYIHSISNPWLVKMWCFTFKFSLNILFSLIFIP